MKTVNKINRILEEQEESFLASLKEEEKIDFLKEKDLNKKILKLTKLIRENEKQKIYENINSFYPELVDKDFLPKIYNYIEDDKDELIATKINESNLRDQFIKLKSLYHRKLQFWKSLVDLIPAPVFIINKDRSFKYFNEPFLNMTGWDSKEVYKVAGASSIFWPQEPASCPVCKIVKKYDMELRKSGIEETKMMRKDKKIIPVSLFVIPVYTETGELSYTFGIVQSRYEEFNRRTEYINKEIEPIIGILNKIADRFLKEKIEMGNESELKSLEKPINEIISTLKDIISSITESSNNISTSSTDVGSEVDNLHAWYKGSFSEVQSSLKEMFGKMESSISKIAQIINLIQSIADQTNLLSLNASIVANKAGEAGRGFGVVASEVRQLAQKSYDAANDVSLIISEIQSNTVDTSNKMKASDDESKELERYLNKISSKTDDIQEVVTSLSEKILGFIY